MRISDWTKGRSHHRFEAQTTAWGPGPPEVGLDYRRHFLPTEVETPAWTITNSTVRIFLLWFPLSALEAWNGNGGTCPAIQ